MPFRPPSPSDGPLAKVDCLAEKNPVTVREDHLADVELVAVGVSDPQKVRYGGLAEKEGVDEETRAGRLRRTTESILVKTWSYELAATSRYKGVAEAMRVEGGGLRRTVEDFRWCRLALVAEHPGVVVPPLGVEAESGDADAPSRWLMLLLEHPQLKSNDALKVFCLGSPSELAAAQRDHVPFKDPTPLAVHLGALYIQGRETLSRKQQQVIEEDKEEEQNEKRRKAGGHLSSSEIRAFAKWLDEEAAAVGAAAKASAAAVAADVLAFNEQKLALGSIAAMAGGAGSATDASPPKFGPARALPELNDMVGYLGAAHDAIYGRDVARRTLAAAKARLEKVEATAAKAKEYADIQAAREAAKKCDEAAKAVQEAQAAREAAEKLEADAKDAAAAAEEKAKADKLAAEEKVKAEAAAKKAAEVKAKEEAKKAKEEAKKAKKEAKKAKKEGTEKEADAPPPAAEAPAAATTPPPPGEPLRSPFVEHAKKLGGLGLNLLGKAKGWGGRGVQVVRTGGSYVGSAASVVTGGIGSRLGGYMGGDTDVAASAELVGRLEARYDEVNATLDAELAAMKALWPDRRRAVADAFSAGEAARAEAATKSKKAVVAALKKTKVSK
jgi:flagellar biosynthesis GTPase FlhF